MRQIVFHNYLLSIRLPVNFLVPAEMSPLPLDWRACIWGNKDYPKYLLYHRLQAQQLEDYKAKLDRPGLFQVAPSILTLLPVLDLELSATSREWQHTGIKNEDDMKNWLNAKAPFQPDPDCRFVYEHTRISPYIVFWLII